MVTDVTGINETDSNGGYHLPSKRKKGSPGGKNRQLPSLLGYMVDMVISSTSTDNAGNTGAHGTVPWYRQSRHSSHTPP